MSRKLKDGSVFYPEQRMSRKEALRSYTWNNAYAAFEEKLRSSLEPGKLADITVLSRDIMTIPEDEIPATDVVYYDCGRESGVRPRGGDAPESASRLWALWRAEFFFLTDGYIL